MNLMRPILVILLLVTTFLSAGCLEPDREGYRDMAAEDYCLEAERCDMLGNLDFGSYDDCEVDMRSNFNDRWPSNECDDGRIDPDAFDTCMNRALNHACTGSITDWLSFADQCQADAVCTN